MLKIFRCDHPASLTDLAEKVDFKNQTLILSNLRSKKEIQNLLLEKNGYVLDESLLRASDFWRLLLRRFHPHKRLISADYARLVISSWLRQNQGKSEFNFPGLSENSTNTLYQMLLQLAPLFLREQNELPLEEWFQENPEVQQRLGDWFALSEKLLLFFKEKNLILLEMIPSLLLDDLNLEKKWNRPLWIDLGSELSLAEAEIFQALSRRLDVHVLSPAPVWKDKYEYLLSPYQYLADQSAKVETWSVDSSKSTNGEERSCKLSGRLGEVKNATGMVRRWLDQGIAPRNIAILAPQIEIYWPSLNSYFEVEGIPCQKNLVIKLISLPSVLHWISTLKSKARGLSNADLETALFSFQEEGPFGFEKFRSVFKNIYHEQDLLRIDDLKDWFLENFDSSQPIARDKFVILALQFWNDDHDKDELEVILRELVANTQINDSFLFADWINFIQKIAAQKEKALTLGSVDGVEVSQLMSGHSSCVTHRIFLGLVEEDFLSSHHHFFNLQDRLQLSRDLGFQIEHPEQNFRGFQLEWLLEQPVQESLLSVGLTHFDGQLLNPLSRWMSQREQEKNLHHLEVEIPAENRWDLLQKISYHEVLKTERQWEALEITYLEKRIQQDSGTHFEEEIQGVQFRVSPSSLINYLECPFIFKSERIYKLISLPEADLDVDPRPQGNLTHRLFEKILSTGSLDQWNDEKLELLIEHLRQEQGSHFFEKDFWQVQKKKYLGLAKRFITFERQWQKDHPTSRPVGFELPWYFYFDSEEMIFLKKEQVNETKPSGRYIQLSGKIDRIDEIKDQGYVILDYKSSSYQISQFLDWIKKQQLQMVFYMWVLEKGFIENFQGKAAASLYYVFKNFKRDTGFRLETLGDEMIGTTKKRSVASSSQKEELFNDFESLLKSTLLEMLKGKFNPQPKELEVCVECRWSLICRVPHLN